MKPIQQINPVYNDKYTLTAPLVLLAVLLIKNKMKLHMKSLIEQK